MITRVRDVYYSVADMKKAVAFYQNILGLRLVYESDGWSAFDVGGVLVGLHERDPGAPPGAVVTFEVANIEAAVAQLKQEGVRFRGAIEHEDFGSLVEFEDPEGNVAKLMECREESA